MFSKNFFTFGTKRSYLWVRKETGFIRFNDRLRLTCEYSNKYLNSFGKLVYSSTPCIESPYLVRLVNKIKDSTANSVQPNRDQHCPQKIKTAFRVIINIHRYLTCYNTKLLPFADYNLNLGEKMVEVIFERA